MKPVVVVGAGITGLTLAHRLKARGRDVVVLEASDRIGGSIDTRRQDGFVAEMGPNTLMTTELTDRLVAEVGLAPEVVAPAGGEDRYIVRRGRPVRLAPGPGAAFAPILSWPAKLRVLGDLFLPAPAELEDESVEAFFTRRFGREVAHYLAGPFVSGVYAGDPARISVRNAFTKLWKAERSHRVGVIRGFTRMSKDIQRETGKPRYRRLTRSFRTGLGALPEALASRLGGAVILGATVAGVAPCATDGARLRVTAADGRTWDASTLVSTLPSADAAALLAALVPAAAEPLAAIRRVPVVTMTLSYPEAAFPRVPRGFGALIPRSEGFRILGCLYVSSFMPGRAPSGRVALTCFVGGAFDPGAVDVPEGDLVAEVHAEVAKLLGVTTAPDLVAMRRWPAAIPQYELGHHHRIAALDAALAPHPALVVMGNWRGGVSLADCIASGEAAAAALAAGP